MKWSAEVFVMLCFVFHGSYGTNFPPVEHPVPIPAPAVQAPLDTPPERFLIRTHQDNNENQRWIPFFVEQRDPHRFPYDVNIGSDESETSEEKSPVATPTPDEITEASGIFPPEITARTGQNTVSVVLPSDFWVGRKDMPNQFMVQRWFPQSIPSPAVITNVNLIKNSDISNQGIKSPPIVINKNPTTVDAINVNPLPSPAKQVWLNGPRVYTSIQSLLQDLPLPNQIKGNVFPINSPPQQPSPLPSPKKTVITQPMKDFPQPSLSVISNKGLDFVNLNAPVSPKVVQIQNGKGIPLRPLNLKDAGAANAWLLNSNAFVSPGRPSVVTPFNVPPASPIPPIKGLGPGVSVTTPIPALSPKTFPYSGSWVIRQGGKSPYFGGLQPAFTSAINGNSKNLPSVISQPKSPKVLSGNVPIPGKSVNQGFILPMPLLNSIVFRRGNLNPKSSGPAAPIVGTLPHSPKSDVIVIGKGSTIAHLAPQKNIPLKGSALPPVASKPCIITNDASLISKDKGRFVFSQPLQTISPMSKVALNTASIRPYSYFIWNPSAQSNFVVMPQTSKQSVPPSNFKSILTAPPPIPQPLLLSQNRFQYPLRYVKLTNLFNPLIDIAPEKYTGVQISTKGQLSPLAPKEPVQPEGENSSSKENSEKESSESKEEGKKKEELIESESESSESPSSAESSEEAESIRVERYQKAPDNTKPSSEQRYSFLAAPKQIRGRSIETPMKPYSFKYDRLDNRGTSHHRQESSDTSGTIRGNYGYKAKDGIYRNVEYVADNSGFRAKVHTNEQGIVGHKSMDANVVANPSSMQTKKQVSSENFSSN